jgi:two-component system alkaline phosphatase synthesis response regulator PhoP
MIYCVEDEASIRELIVYTLKKSGFDAVGFPDAESFLSMLQKQLPSLILLDIMLPDDDGIEILKRIRLSARTREIPVIMLTAKGSEYNIIVGLDSGADDYITKPFGMMELISRIKAVLRRSAKDEVAPIRIGKLTIDKSRHTAAIDEERLALTHKEFALLCLLAENAEKVFTRDMLLQSIWGYEHMTETRTVDVHIRSLRAKLGSCGDYIQTVRGVGYKMGGNL